MLRLKKANTQLEAIADGVQVRCASMEAPIVPGCARTFVRVPDSRPHRAQGFCAQLGRLAGSVLKGELFAFLASGKANKTT